jgi:hypothetical protein
MLLSVYTLPVRPSHIYPPPNLRVRPTSTPPPSSHPPIRVRTSTRPSACRRTNLLLCLTLRFALSRFGTIIGIMSSVSTMVLLLSRLIIGLRLVVSVSCFWSLVTAMLWSFSRQSSFASHLWVLVRFFWFFPCIFL